MLSESIIIAIIGAVVSIIGSASVINWRLKELEKRVDSHNSYALKFSEATTDIALIHKDIEYIKEKLDERKAN